MRNTLLGLALVTACGRTPMLNAADQLASERVRVEPFGPPAASGANAGEQDLFTPTEAVERVRLSLEFLRRTRIQEAPEAAADALHAMADGLRSLPASDFAEVQNAIGEVRSKAVRLSNSGLTFEGARWTKQGLSVALTCLEELTPDARGSELRPWFDSARRAVDELDETRSIALQRAEMQDGFRTVSAVFALTAQRTRLDTPE